MFLKQTFRWDIPMKNKLRRVLTIIASIIGVLILLVYIGLPIGMAIATVTPNREASDQPPAGFNEITLTTEDNETLAAWYLPPQNGAVIILIHGAGGSRSGMRNYAEMLAKNGYGVMALDLRGHGQSSGKTNRLGWDSTLDVGAAVSNLLGRAEVKRIGGMGVSMGGEVLLGAVSQYPALAAVVADGATRRCLEDLMTLPEERPLVRNFTARVMYAGVQLFSGEQSPQPTLLTSMTQAESTRFLWIAAGGNSLETTFNRLFASSIGQRGDLWVAPDVAHTGAFARYPDEYEQRVVGFFNQTLLE
jgi:pimeloyl-ACP methyl ester carboxylesterase